MGPVPFCDSVVCFDFMNWFVHRANPSARCTMPPAYPQHCPLSAYSQQPHSPKTEPSRDTCNCSFFFTTAGRCMPWAVAAIAGSYWPACPQRRPQQPHINSTCPWEAPACCPGTPEHLSVPGRSCRAVTCHAFPVCHRHTLSLPLAPPNVSVAGQICNRT